MTSELRLLGAGSQAAGAPAGLGGNRGPQGGLGPWVHGQRRRPKPSPAFCRDPWGEVLLVSAWGTAIPMALFGCE